MATFHQYFRKTVLFVSLVTPLSINSLLAQKIDTPTFQTEQNADGTAKKWSGGASLGLDAAGVSLINPRVNEGEGRINIGGMFNFWANYQKKSLIWNTKGCFQLALSQDGENFGWMKSTDALMLNTQIGVRLRKHWYLAMMTDVQTQLLKTYDGKFLSSQSEDFNPRPLTSGFFSPATVKLAPGFLWKPKPYFSLLMSAVSNKNIIVANNNLAYLVDSATNQSVFGNNGSNISSQFGAQLRADLNLKLANDRILLSSTLDLYSNYLKSPENIAVEWCSQFDAILTEHLSFCLRSDMFYDHNILVRINGNPDNLGQRVFVRNTFLLKYNRNF